MITPSPKEIREHPDEVRSDYNVSRFGRIGKTGIVL